MPTICRQRLAGRLVTVAKRRSGSCQQHPSSPYVYLPETVKHVIAMLKHHHLKLSRMTHETNAMTEMAEPLHIARQGGSKL